MNLSSWRVSTRLTVSFGAVCALLVICIVTGILALQRTSGDLERISHRDLPELLESTSLMSNADAIAIALRNMMLSNDPSDRTRLTQAIAAARQSNAAALENINKTATSPEKQALLAKVQATRDAYRAGADQLAKLVLADQVDESRLFLNETLRPMLANYKGAIQAFIDAGRKAADQTGKDAQSAADNARTLLIGLGLIALALAAVLGWLISRSLLRELGGEPAEAAQMAQALAAGDFTRSIQVKSGDGKSLMAQLSSMKSSLGEVVTRVRRSSDSVAVASAQIAQGNQDLSARTESQASALEETAASMEQLGATVRQNADSANQANQLALSASEVAARGGNAVNQVVQTMRGIHESSTRIADIISVIDGIAFQTNILALNAAVEAARAGEQGRGFAVVAGEVRSLAGRSAEAAKEIKQLIQESVDRVSQGSTMVNEAGETMTEVVTSIRRVTDLMSEISAASNEQASGVAQVGEAVTQMDQATQQNAALVEEMAAAAASLNTQAQDLVQAVSIFKLGSESASAPARATTPAPRHAPPPPAARKPVKPAALAKAAPKAAALPAAPAPRAAAPASSEGEWESF